VLYLSGASPSTVITARRPDLGLMLQPANSLWRFADRCGPWAVDHATFRQPWRFDLDHYLAWLERVVPWRDRCVFVTAPDMWGNAQESLAFGVIALPELKLLSFPVALPVQDGSEDCDLPWGIFDTLFIGGSDPWRDSRAVEDLTAEALRRQKHLHLGRVNSRRRVERARQLGCQSCDGTFLAFGPRVNYPGRKSGAWAKLGTATARRHYARTVDARHGLSRQGRIDARRSRRARVLHGYPV